MVIVRFQVKQAEGDKAPPCFKQIEVDEHEEISTHYERVAGYIGLNWKSIDFIKVDEEGNEEDMVCTNTLASYGVEDMETVLVRVNNVPDYTSE
ncbi:hypothetical protein GGI21_002372 [Coemansia aciculifera]|nr:hypothetical protein GGI21_002372 [Coemansia aciculifera]